MLHLISAHLTSPLLTAHRSARPAASSSGLPAMVAKAGSMAPVRQGRSAKATPRHRLERVRRGSRQRKKTRQKQMAMMPTRTTTSTASPKKKTKSCWIGRLPTPAGNGSYSRTRSESSLSSAKIATSRSVLKMGTKMRDNSKAEMEAAAAEVEANRISRGRS